MRWRHELCTIALVCSAMTGAHAQSCSSGPWSDPTPIVPGATASRGAARFASLALARDTVFLAGSGVLHFDRPTARERLLRAWTLSGSPFGAPKGDFYFAHPQLAVDARGRLHLLWAEPAAPPPEGSHMWMMLPSGSVWSAVRTPSGWTDPVRLYQGLVYWGKAFNDRLASGSGMLAIASGGMHRSIVFVFDGNAWRVHERPVSTGAIPSSTAIHRGVVYTAHLGAVADGADRNSVFLASSADQGITWTSSTVVQRSGATPAFDPRLMVDSGGTLHLVWAQARADGSVAIRLVRSNDRGTTWSSPSDLTLSEPYNALQAVIDACGRVHVAFEHLPRAGGGHIDHAYWDGGWKNHQHLFPGLRTSDPTLAATGAGRAILTMLAQRADAPITGDYVSMFSELRRQ